MMTQYHMLQDAHVQTLHSTQDKKVDCSSMLSQIAKHTSLTENVDRLAFYPFIMGMHTYS